MNKELWLRVADIQKDFEYTPCHSKDGKVKSWLCGKTGTNVYRFEIVIGQCGIYMGGDIDSLSWRVCRDISFLAGSDIDYYIYSKLESRSKENEFCLEKAEKFIAYIMSFYLEDTDRSTEKYIKIALRNSGYTKDQYRYDDHVMEIVENMAAEMWDRHMTVMRKCDEHEGNVEEIAKCYEDLGYDLCGLYPGWALYEATRYTEDEREIDDALNEHLYDYDGSENFYRPSDSVMFRLYMVCYAARKILDQENK